MLTEEQIYECEDAAEKSYRRHKYSVRGQQITPADDPNWHIARAIEAEVRKKDEALIRELVEALEHHIFLTRPITDSQEALTAARARLEDAK